MSIVFILIDEPPLVSLSTTITITADPINLSIALAGTFELIIISNYPDYDINNFSVGNGILYLGLVGVTPTIDVGATRNGAVLTVERKQEEVWAGAPLTRIDVLAVRENVTFSIVGIEWNFSNLARVLGISVGDYSGNIENLTFDKDPEFRPTSLLFRHVTPVGHTIYIKLWESAGSGVSEVRFEEGLHELVYSFEAQESKFDWAGNSLNEDRRLFEIERIKV